MIIGRKVSLFASRYSYGRFLTRVFPLLSAFERTFRSPSSWAVRRPPLCRRGSTTGVTPWHLLPALGFAGVSGLTNDM